MPSRRRYWLLKSEPDAFSFDDLLAAPKRRTFWDGVRNYQARNLLRDELAVGDGVLYYHSNAAPPGIAGVARVVVAGEPDPTQFDARDAHHDPRSDRAAPRWYGVTIEGLRAAPRFVTLDALKARPALADMALVQRGQRLSVQPVTAAQWRLVLRMAGLPARVL
jgi:predicted RNA-binding protein with PUA-like domain